MKKTYIVILETTSYEKYEINAVDEDEAYDIIMSGNEIPIEVDAGEFEITNIYEKGKNNEKE
jgi:hypothetical protein